MNRKIRLIWNFRGPDAQKTAEHHVIHLKEFAEINGLIYHDSNILTENPFLCLAYIIINEKDLSIFKDRLKPDRGTVVKD